MKKLFLLFVTAMLAVGMMAQDELLRFETDSITEDQTTFYQDDNEFQHEIGVIVGGINGVSYKYWITEELAVQADLAVGLTAAPGKMYTQGQFILKGTNPQYDFTLNPNLEYHFTMRDNFLFYLGGGINLGLVSDLTNTNPETILGKFGINAVFGYAMHFDQFVLALDFRPGYGLGFYEGRTLDFHFFDWKLGLALRYRL